MNSLNLPQIIIKQAINIKLNGLVFLQKFSAKFPCRQVVQINFQSVTINKNAICLQVVFFYTYIVKVLFFIVKIQLNLFFDYRRRVHQVLVSGVTRHTRCAGGVVAVHTTFKNHSVHNVDTQQKKCVLVSKNEFDTLFSVVYFS